MSSRVEGTGEYKFNPETREAIVSFQGATVDLAVDAAKIAAKIGLAALATTGGGAAGAAAGAIGGAAVSALFVVEDLVPGVERAIEKAGDVVKGAANSSVDASERSVGKIKACVDSSFGGK